MVDLDHFQDVNDTLGHHHGDSLLVEVGRRLRSGIREGDEIARMGGDEFAILFDGIRGVDSAVSVARRVGRALQDPFIIDGVQLSVKASTGVAVHPVHGGDAATLLRHADMAMSAAKLTRTTIAVFDFDQGADAERRLALANDLRPAVARGEIQTLFQPKVRMEGGRTVGFEALARWTHPERGPIPPAEFIPLAEHVGLIEDLTFHVLDLAITRVSEWRRMDPEMTVSVNVPPRVVSEERFAERVLAALARRQVPAAALLLELTESDELEPHNGTRDAMLRLDAAGVRFSMDDFGTGYSSLAYLQGLPVREVKIDRSFVLRMADNPTDAAIVAATIQLVHSLGRRVVAEGVETEETWRRLESLGCDEVQGFLVSRPISAGEAAGWVAEPGWAAPATVDR
jgi:diguanylate cyclase (GGDEF)-like protein